MSRLKELEQKLLITFEDLRLSKLEKYELQKLVTECSEEERRFLKNRAFAIFREHLNHFEDAADAYSWLERCVKALALPQNHLAKPRVYFSPGETCRQAIVHEIKNAREKIQICVFTISDNVISEALLQAFEKGIDLKIITDNEKKEDRGSDINALKNAGIAVREDASPDHMHHKFAIFDNDVLINGSFNWTRSASLRNHENIVVHRQPQLVAEFQREFARLWTQFSKEGRR